MSAGQRHRSRHPVGLGHFSHARSSGRTGSLANWLSPSVGVIPVVRVIPWEGVILAGPRDPVHPGDPCGPASPRWVRDPVNPVIPVARVTPRARAVPLCVPVIPVAPGLPSPRSCGQAFVEFLAKYPAPASRSRPTTMQTASRMS